MEKTLLITRSLRIRSALNEIGIDADMIFRKFRISPELGKVAVSPSVSKYVDLINAIAASFERPALGAEIGNVRTLRELGVVGYILKNAPSFGQALTTISNHINLTLPGARLSLSEEKDLATVTFHLDGFSDERCRHEVELNVVHLIGVTRQLLDQVDWAPTGVFFRHNDVGQSPLLEQFSGACVTYDHFFSGLRFPRHYLDYNPSNADPELLRVLERLNEVALNSLQESRSFLDRVTLIVTSRITEPGFNLDDVAAEIGMSRRSLHRKLQEKGTSFRTIRSDTMMRAAKESLISGSQSVTQLAHQLGYSDASAFNRFFLKQAGVTPLQYRKQQLKLSA